ncbi:hypothetical protein D3C71_1699570 [compost metagenome]
MTGRRYLLRIQGFGLRPWHGMGIEQHAFHIAFRCVIGAQPKLAITSEVARANRSDRSLQGLKLVKFDMVKAPSSALPRHDLAVLVIGEQLIKCILTEIDLIHQRRFAGGD